MRGQLNEVILKMNEDVNTINHHTMFGENILHIVSKLAKSKDQDQYLKIARLALSLGVDPNLTYSRKLNHTALCWAASNNNLDLCELLLEHGAFVDGLDETAMTPLHEACLNNCFEAANLLLNHGADVNRLGHLLKFTAIDFLAWAQRTKDVSMQDVENVDVTQLRQLLLKYGAISVADDIDAKTSHFCEYLVYYISQKLGPVYPFLFGEKFKIGESVIMMALERKSKDPKKFLFTTNYHLIQKKIDLEFVFVLTDNWPILKKYRNLSSIATFPINVLNKIYTEAENGRYFDENTCIHRANLDWNTLTWPNDIEHIVFVNSSKIIGVYNDEKNKRDVKILVAYPMTNRQYEELNLLSKELQLKTLQKAKLNDLVIEHIFDTSWVSTKF